MKEDRTPWELMLGLTLTGLTIIGATVCWIYEPVNAAGTEDNRLELDITVPAPALPDPSKAFEIKANFEKAKEVTAEASGIKKAIDSVEFPTMQTELTSLGKYYITGYTSIECGGSTTTASGTTCHKAESIADSISNPTTCAIDPALHDFGDVFYIEGFGYYIAEDTGSAVKGKHLDLYFWDGEYNYALSITGKYEVFAVEYIETTYKPAAYDIRDKVAEMQTGWTFKTQEEAKWN